MSIVGEFALPAASFSLERSLAEVPAMTVESERLATHSTMQAMPFLWASGGDFDAFTDALGSDPTVETVEIAERTERARLYQLEWSDDVVEMIDSMVDHEAAIVEARARADEWRFKLRFTTEEQVSAFQKYFDEQGHSFEVQRLYHPDEAYQREYDLTEQQYDTLVAAFEDGYFDVPRTTSVEELAGQLGVSANAVSQRIRRASASLIGSTIAVTDGSGAEGDSDDDSERT